MLAIDEQIRPHGGVLVERVAPEGERAERRERAGGLAKVELSARALSDVEMIATGVFSPLEGFMVREDYESVVREMKLANGLIWSLPITLSVSREQAGSLSVGEEVALVREGGQPVATMTVEDIYDYDKEHEAREVFWTTNEEHPGVAAIYRQEEVLIGGKVELIEHPHEQPFPQYYFEPKELRAVFAEKDWKRVVGFQTRNPVHRAHEYIQKSALEIVDGLLLNPLVGETRAEDIPADVRMRSYEVILEKYFPKDRTQLAVFPAAMRYGGPREAVFHAICRKNYGCTHFIVGRDHAGPGKDSGGKPFYGDYDAQEIFEQIDLNELEITPLFYEHAFYCTRTEQMATQKTSPGTPEERVFFSGTRVREMLNNGEYPPAEFSRPEVIEVLIEGQRAGQQ